MNICESHQEITVLKMKTQWSLRTIATTTTTAKTSSNNDKIFTGKYHLITLNIA